MDAGANPTAKSANKHLKTDKYLGLDVHKVDTEIAVADGGRSGEVRVYGKVSSDLVTTERALRKIRAGPAGVAS